MPLSSDARDFSTRLQRLGWLTQKMEQVGDPQTRDHMRELLQCVLDLHGAGLDRVLTLLEDGGAASAPVLDACARDEVISGLLLLHGLHPLDLEERVSQALEQVRPYLRSHGGNVELVSIQNGIVRLRLEGSCHGCPSSAITMKQTIEEAIVAKAPDAIGVEVDSDTVESPSVTPDGLALVTLKVS
jgi:Fe-S cluster biogenesis protein NfuA